MRFRLATEEDLEYMSENSINQRVDRKLMETVDYVYTLTQDDVPLGTGGFRMITPTCCWCWIDITKEARKHALTFFRATRDWIDQFGEIQGIKRMFVQTN